MATYWANGHEGGRVDIASFTRRFGVPAVKAAVEVVRKDDPAEGPVQADAVTSSGSGLDPHASPAYALRQVARIAAATGLLEPRIRELVARRTDELSARNEELSGALGRVRQLSGLLPICSCCKKIRDDRGYWNQLEQYFSEQSDVGFSHGICPECVGTMFPGRGQ